MPDAWIVDAVRTPRGKGRAEGSLHGIHPQALFGQCLVALAERVGFDPGEVDDVVAGNGILRGEHGDDIARLSALLIGWPETVPGGGYRAAHPRPVPCRGVCARRRRSRRQAPASASPTPPALFPSTATLLAPSASSGQSGKPSGCGRAIGVGLAPV